MITPLIIAFGSQVKGKATEKSDFDFGALNEHILTLSERTDLAGYIAEKFNIDEDKIDLVDIASASPLLKFQVAQNGSLIDGDYADFVRFKVRAFKEYVDTEKFRRLRKKTIMEKYA